MRSRGWIFFLLWMWGYPALAQQYNFRTYSVGDGLPQSQVYAICEDGRGYLWLGTRGGGLCRFDGRSFTPHTQSDGLASNYIRALIEDKKGRIWIGTDEGISMYDGAAFHTVAEPKKLAGNAIHCLLQLKEGLILAGTDTSGLWIYNGKEWKPHPLNKTLPHPRVTALYEDRYGQLWVGTELGLVRSRASRVQTITTQDGLAGNAIRGVVEDRKGRIWIATYGGGLSRYNGERMERIRMQDGLAGNTLLSIAVHPRRDEVWIGTAGNGLSRWTPDTFTTYTTHEGLCNNLVSAIHIDSEGNLWLGTSGGGVCRLDGERFVHFGELPRRLGDVVFSFYQDSTGKMWLGSSMGGATTYDGQVYERYTGESGFSDGKVRAIHADAQGNLWFGMQGDGAWRFDGQFFHHLSAWKEGLSGNFVYDIAHDTEGNVWFATVGGGVSLLPADQVDKPRSRFRHFREYHGLGSDRVYALEVDKKGRIWVGLDHGGLSCIFRNTDSSWQIENYPLPKRRGNNTIRSLSIDKEGNIWLGTAGGGIGRFRDGEFKFYDREEGLASGNIYTLIFDQHGDLWTGTEKGVDRITLGKDGQFLEVRHFGQAEGFTGIETIMNAAFVDRQGRLWFGTVNGTTRYDARYDQQKRTPPRVHITGIRLFFDPIEKTVYGKNTRKWFPLPEELTLPHHQNHLSFAFTGIDLSNPQRVQFRWKLEGFDDKWSPANDRNEATYSNLPPGDYIFKVMAGNGRGIWTKEPAEYHFHIQPPYWDTLPFKGGVALGGIILVGGLTGLRIRQIRRRNAQERRQLELEKNLVELEQQALLLQMNPHFIANALQSIQGFISGNEPQEAKRYLAKFSRLMRLILKSSREAWIPLSDELSLLENYLSLERLCHNRRFRYEVLYDGNENAEDILIPPMLIQPFVENAVVHGIKNTGDEGCISVRFNLEGKKFVRCTVTDNGPGLAATSKNKDAEHRSSAIEITRERLILIHGSLKLADLSEQSNDRSGTSVHVILPGKLR